MVGVTEEKLRLVFDSSRALLSLEVPMDTRADTYSPEPEPEPRTPNPEPLTPNSNPNPNPNANAITLTPNP